LPFLFTDPATPEISTLSLHDALPISTRVAQHRGYRVLAVDLVPERLERAGSHGVEVYDLREHDEDLVDVVREATDGRGPDSVLRSEEHTSELQSRSDLVCRLLLEKKK